MLVLPGLTLLLLATPAVGQQDEPPEPAAEATAEPEPQGTDPLQPALDDGGALSLFQATGEADLNPEQQRMLDAIRNDPAASDVVVGEVPVEQMVDVGRLSLDVPGTDEAADAVFEGLEVDRRSAGDFSLFAGDLDTSTSLVVDGQDVYGTIYVEGELYKVQPLGGGLTALYRYDTSQLEDHPPEFEEEMREGGSLDAPPPQRLDLGEGEQDSGSTIDVLVAYTEQARIEAGNIDALIQLAVDETNRSFQNSGVWPRINLVHSYETDYDEATSIYDDRNRFSGTTDGFMDEVHRLRNTHRADIAMLIVGNGSYCGVAYIMADNATAFGVVRRNCATGYYSFGHEMGHLFGARHNPESDPTNEPFAYGHGYCNDAANWRTVMSYNDGCPTRVDHWSNPSRSYNGATTGSAARHNNARVINGTAPLIANFRVRSGTPCRVGFTPVGARLCISTNVAGARSFANALVHCMDRRARVASYSDLRYLYTRSALDAAFNPNGRWLGDWTGDDEVVCGNRSITSDGDGDTGNFDGTCNRFDNRGFWCAYDR